MIVGQKSNTPLTVLVDNSVLSYGIVAHGIRVPVPGMINQLFLIQVKPARTAEEKWLKRQIEALPTIARLAREQIIKLHTYSELILEAWRRPGSFPKNPFGDVFSDIKLDHVPAAVNRDVFFQSDLATQIKNEAMIEFCRWLLNGYSDAWLDAPYIKGHLSETQIQNLRNVERFRAICRPLSEKQYVDAFHVWTGEVNELPYFLTIDGKFSRAISQARNLNLRCEPIFPSELLDKLGVSERDPLPFEYGRRYTLGGILYD